MGLGLRIGCGCCGTTLAGCPCTGIPTTLTQDVVDPTLNFGVFHPCTFTFGPTPTEYLPLSVGASGFFSNESFTDSSSPDVFRYWLTCFQAAYQLGRLYAHSAQGSPFRDQFRYSWLIGTGASPATGYPHGNTCSPFYLGHGTVYQGGDTNVRVFIHP